MRVILKIQVVKAVLVNAVALAAFFGARDQGDKVAFYDVLLVEIQKRLKATATEVNQGREILTGASTGNLPGHATLISSFVLAPNDQVLHPTDIMNWQLSLIQCAVICGCGARMVKKIHTIFAEEWAYIIEHQRFLLSQPSLHVRVLSDECEPVSVSPTPLVGSGSEKAAPLGESGGAGLLVGVAVLEVALRRKVVVDRGMD